MSDNPAAAPPRRRRRTRLLSRGDKLFLSVLIGLPLLALLLFVWLPALASVGLSFTRWNGIGIGSIHWIGLENYRQIFTNYPPFWPAIQHNLIWLVFTALIPTPFGIFIAYQLDRKIKFGRFYQTAIFLPVVLSTAVVGFIWEIVYNPDHGLLNSALGTDQPGHGYIDWLGDPNLNLWSVLVAASWRHAGYVMVLYLAGLKSFDPALKDAASIDGANGRQTFLRVVVPALKPINVTILVITVMESLRAFDMVYVLSGNDGSKPGLEMLSLLITNNTVGEASRPGYGSALATMLLVVSLTAIVAFLVQNFRKERQA
jgi:multiple sugar transport system permease protein/raffinose/stachyose/melibiose transport system permease protein